ncbi:E3 ubiquitin-protein ligase TRIM33-like [Mya arenaria]|uniref:E3 ubiquitin-protein ligase TRIM33-like n=1 Tax=Mya arenaria TaxID=6604 RepID=UPI0022E55158|nr:E3 ubiquitin-protein ligase TRIM33-like [Mya arenaria]
MEVSGKKLRSNASLPYATYCQPCSNDGEILPAEAYCTVCKEFICSTCTNIHKKQKILRSHALLDKKSMPTAMNVPSFVPQSTLPCDVHPEEFIKYFCPTHQTLNCGHCLVKDHRTCHVDIISEISRGFKDCKEYEDISKAFSQLSKTLECCAEDAELKLKVIKELAEDEVSNLQEYRAKVNTYFDERVNALMTIIEKMKNIDEVRLHSIKPKCDDLRAKVEEIESKLAEQEKNSAHLFIEVKKAQKQVEILQLGLADINKKMTFHRYHIRKDPATERLLSSSTGLGTVEEIASSGDSTSFGNDVRGCIGEMVNLHVSTEVIKSSDEYVRKKTKTPNVKKNVSNDWEEYAREKTYTPIGPIQYKHRQKKHWHDMYGDEL